MLKLKIVVRDVVADMKSPGTVRRVPYTISGEEHPRSSLGVFRIPKSTQGSSRVQLRSVRCAVFQMALHQAIRLRVVDRGVHGGAR